jgi:CO/xanthine dehydrogenase FAD-binding subunit
MSEVFKPKQFRRAQSVEETSELLKQYGEGARIIAGGTGIYEVAHRGLLSEVEVLLDISSLNLSYVKLEEQFARIGASTTMSTIFESKQLEGYPELSALFDALRAIQPLQVKNVATIAGAICTALPFFDLPVSLIAMDADVVIAPGSRFEKLLEFVQGYFSVDLHPGEFVKEIRIPLSDDNETSGSAFQKFAITGDDWAIINCGASVKIEGGSISETKVCFGGGVGEKPKRAVQVEKMLRGIRATDETGIKTVLEEGIENDLETVSDIRASAQYRTHLAKVLGRRTIMNAAKIASGVK